MSTESLDPQLIEQTKQQIRTLVNEIAQLSKSEASPGEYYQGFLERVVQALAAVGGIIWTLEDQSRINVGYQINFQETRLRDRPDDQKRHGRLIQRALQSGEGMIVPPHSGGADEEEGSNPTDFLLVLGCIRTDIETVGVVEILQRPEAGPTTQKGYLRFLLQMCDLASDFFKSRQIRHFADRQVLWTQLEDFARAVHTTLDPKETAYTIANEGRRLIECDRVSVAIRRGKKCLIEAVSGQDMVDKRSNQVRLLGNLATAVVASNENMWYTGDTTDMAPQVEDAVQEYVDESHSKTVAVIPLMRARQDPEEEEAHMRDAPDPPVGALIVELIEDSRVPEKMLQRVDVVARHAAPAMANSIDHDSLFLMPLWRTIGQQKWILKARTLPKTLAIAGAVLAVLLALAIVPISFTVRAKGTLEPITRQDVFAGVDGVVEEVKVKHGVEVHKGDLLVKMRDTELQMKQAELQGELNSTGELLQSVYRQSVEGKNLSPVERAELMGRQAELQQKYDSIGHQLDIYDRKIQELQVVSPIDGVVVTWDVQNRLLNRPVQRGQVLLRVADPTSDWQLEINMPEKYMGHIERARKQIKEDLDVEYILAIQPGTSRYGTVSEVHKSAEVKEEQVNSVQVKVKIDTKKLTTELPGIRPGASVNAKVACGYRPVGYVWFHEAIEYVQTRIIFPWL
jgi:multidrug efflux pump subunit AcrA (membrane-fusion protein)